MPTRRSFIQKITAATIAFPVITEAAAACTSGETKSYDGPVLQSSDYGAW